MHSFFFFSLYLLPLLPWPRRERNSRQIERSQKETGLVRRKRARQREILRPITRGGPLSPLPPNQLEKRESKTRDKPCDQSKKAIQFPPLLPASSERYGAELIRPITIGDPVRPPTPPPLTRRRNKTKKKRRRNETKNETV